MLRFIKKSLLWIVSGTVSVILTACYGVGSMAECFSKKITVTDSEGNPIKGIEVRFSYDLGYMDHVQTDESGKAEINFCTDYNEIIATLVDIDGTDNGEFEDKTVVFSTDDNPETVEMESVE
jgi:putative lipoprotein (rSAM/lipoprotein system)